MLSASAATASEKARGATLLDRHAPSSSDTTPRATDGKNKAPVVASLRPQRVSIGGPGAGGRRSSPPWGPRLSTLIGRLGAFSAQHAHAMLGLCVLTLITCLLALATGVVTVVVETDSTKLWSPHGQGAQVQNYTSLFEDPFVAVAIVASRSGGSLTQLPHVMESVKLDEAIRRHKTETGDDFHDLCYRPTAGAECAPSSIYTLWNNTIPGGESLTPAISMIRSAVHAAAHSSNIVMSSFLGCLERLPEDSMATFRMMRLVYQLKPGEGATAWAEAFQRATLHGDFEQIAVSSIVPGSYDEELSGMSWGDLSLCVWWLPMLLVGVPVYMGHSHGFRALEAAQLLVIEVLAIALSITGALVLMAYLRLPISPMWLAAPLLAMGYGLDDMFVLLSAFTEARRSAAAAGVRPSLEEHIQLAFESAGISCLCTSLTSFVVFIIGGATSNVLAIKSFCWLSAIIAILDFGLQVAVFGAAIAVVLKPRYEAESRTFKHAARGGSAALTSASVALAKDHQADLALADSGAGGAVGLSGAPPGPAAGSSATHGRTLAFSLPVIFAEPYCDPAYSARSSTARVKSMFMPPAPKWSQVIHQFTFIPLVFVALVCTYCATSLTESEVPLGIDVAGLAKAGSYLIEFDNWERTCFDKGEWGYVYVQGGEPDSFAYQEQVRHLAGALEASPHVLEVTDWLSDFADSYDGPPTHSEVDAKGEFSSALFSWLGSHAQPRTNGGNVVWTRDLAAGDEADETGGARASSREGDPGETGDNGTSAPADREKALDRAHRAGARRGAARLLTAEAPLGDSNAPSARPADVILTRELQSAEEAAEVRVRALRIPMRIAPCNAAEAAANGESTHECMLRAMLDIRATVEEAKGLLDAVPYTPSFPGLEQYITMRADVRRALMRCTLAAAAITFVLVLGYSVWEALVVSLVVLASLVMCNVIILGVMKQFAMNLHFLSAIMLQMGVGFIVDYHIHIASKFMATRVGATAVKRMVKTIESVGSAVLASMVTTLLVVLPFLWARWAAMRMLMTLMFVIVAVGGVFSLGVLPIVIAFIPRSALAPAPGRSRHAAWLDAQALRLAALGVLATPPTGRGGDGSARVSELCEFAATRISSRWRGFWCRKQWATMQHSNALFLAQWKLNSVTHVPRPPVRLTMHTRCCSHLRRNVYAGFAGIHVCLIVLAFAWEAWTLLVAGQGDAWSIICAVVNTYLQVFFCGFILTMVDPHERHNIVLNALAPVHPSLLEPDAHLKRKSPRESEASTDGSSDPDPDSPLARGKGALVEKSSLPHHGPGATSSSGDKFGVRRGIFPKEAWPKVAIIIPCFKEPNDIIALTMKGCLRQVYPPSSLHVYLLDDNQNQLVRDERKAAMQEAYRECFEVAPGRLIAEHKRPAMSVVWRPDNAHAKAGNMNHWMEKGSQGFAWEFFAIFDCDMVPHPFFVQEMLPAMLNITRAQPAPEEGRAGTDTPGRDVQVTIDESVCFISTRQVFGDAPPLDPLGHRQDMMYDTWEPTLDRTDQALFLGTNAIFNRKAVDAVGRFPTNCLTEDTLICLRLHTAGFRALYYPRTFCRGLAPGTIRSAFRQRCRWAHGNLQILWNYNPLRNPKLDWRMRVVFTTVLVVNMSGPPILFVGIYFFLIHLGAIQMPNEAVALGLLKLFIWMLQYILLFNTSHINPWLARPIMHVWRQTQMALCYTFCGTQIMVEQAYKRLKQALCNVVTVDVFKPTIDTTRKETSTPPATVQLSMITFVVTIAIIAHRWYETLLPLVSDKPVDPEDFVALFSTWILFALPFMLGWPWTKVFINEQLAARRAQVQAHTAAAAAGK
mmetsp:Transcript_18730/g.59351  ORF Transcript_18730/g.59351 Transcript_18730/m.59351 type:complete len:1818 (+) Transcript_18730:97-5550(+)